MIHPFPTTEREVNVLLYRTFIKDESKRFCRECLNEKHGIKLVTKDCRYWSQGMAECHWCRRMKNIVSGLSLMGKVKLAVAKK